MTAREAIGSIEPGSTEYGDRAGLEQGLQEVMGAAPAAPGGPTTGSGPDTAGLTGTDPISAMLSGDLGLPGGGPTDGMSVGAGPNRVEDNPMMSDKAARLRAIAESAKTPSIRYSAQRMLQSMSRSKKKL